MKGDLEKVEALLAKGANVKAVSEGEPNTPLHYAAG